MPPPLSQCVFRVEAAAPPQTLWLTEDPSPRLERVVGAERVSDVDPEFRPFFAKPSLRPTGLFHQEYRSVRPIVRVPRREAGNVSAPEFQARLALPATTDVQVDDTFDADDPFAFIYRARYRA
jgi:hypothetical protein